MADTTEADYDDPPRTDGEYGPGTRTPRDLDPPDGTVWDLPLNAECGDDDFDDDVYPPAPPTPTFEQRTAQASRYGITVTPVTDYPGFVASMWQCPKCGQVIEVRCPRDAWRLTEQGTRIASAHPDSLCKQIRRERTPHAQWGIDYGVGEVQKHNDEETARAYVDECVRSGGERYTVVSRQVGPWTAAPAPAT